ncbi:putative integral membrane protein (TIGR00698 family) [Desulfobaculum xiamenense]|uniref:Putative integral membrane protein (TIGR00698 family) n=1 Tax=Desulfobaculum xiamenense TaxID=995050 RepID=A0A846QXA1_9BACT|nr:putative sulfate exporter family transporter [Desulfobaculum xiamenense]NJB69249.1 putative integral membrane protein (TIGR00698 family) [Desulfobaculum xiamenense]
MAHGELDRPGCAPVWIVSVIMLAYAALVQSGAVTDALKYLHVHKEMDTMVILGYVGGILGVVTGVLLNARRDKAITNFDTFVINTIPGILFIVLLAMTIRWFAEPLVVIASKGLEGAFGFSMYKVLNLNYVVLGILVGIIITNTWGIPHFAASGVKTARFVLKMGVILLGARYSFAELAKLGMTSVWMIGFFVLGTVFMVLWLGRIFNQPKSMSGVLSAGMGVCGVSATVACAPVVRARCSEMAYTIGTILGFGVLCMFAFPTIGKIVGMTPTQFGAWAGTGILNSAQVAAACLAYNAVDIKTLKVGEIFNITRVLFLPVIVLVLAMWYGREVGQKLSFKEVVIDKFPLFILGFLLLFLMSSVGLFSPPSHYKGKYLDFSYSQRTEVTPEELEVVKGAVAQGVPGLHMEEAEALSDLAHQRQLAGNFADKDNSAVYDTTARKRMDALESILARAKGKEIAISAELKSAVNHAVKQVHKKSKTIVALTDAMMWFFAYGLIGLGMQITRKAIAQAGSWPLAIGLISGVTKATLSFLVVILFVKEVVLK